MLNAVCYDGGASVCRLSVKRAGLHCEKTAPVTAFLYRLFCCCLFKEIIETWNFQL